MNLRNVESYSIGLDIGTNSVGWAVVDQEGDLCRFKGKPTWGARLFSDAETAESTRLKRGLRRRYQRRRQRLDLLQGFFAEEMAKVDEDFFIRLNQSRLWVEDRSPDCGDYRFPLFNGDPFDEVEYYDRFPTIFHLRKWLLDADEKADIRLIYLAFHSIVKHRGNFLFQDKPSLKAADANMLDSVTRFAEAFAAWCDEQGIVCAVEHGELVRILENRTAKPSDKQRRIKDALGLDKDYAKTATAFAKALVGHKAEFSDAFLSEPSENSSFDLSNDEKVDSYEPPDEAAELFDAVKAVYSSFVLMGILDGSDGRTISYSKVSEYERYGRELALLKQLVKEYAPARYDGFFRGPLHERVSGGSVSRSYDASKASGYTKYNLGASKLDLDGFHKEILKLFKGTAAESDERYQQVLEGIAAGTFLRRLRTSENGCIPYQLHLEEMVGIIKKQARFYPFLQDQREKIESLVSFRIPYYVGPLAAAKEGEERRFAWSVRKPGMEGKKVYPWNWDEVIDKNASAELFIRRMTGKCTYLQDQDVLPRCSLTYEMFCVLNELNGAKHSQGGDRWFRFDYADRRGIIEDLFKTRKSVSYASVEKWLDRAHGPGGFKSAGGSFRVSGGQGETKFESKLSSWNDFCKILGVESIEGADFAMVEEIILWNTVFEDRSILRDKIKAAYGNRLSGEQIGAICRKRYTGWGRLSKKLLVGLKVETDNGSKSIMDILEEGCQNNCGRIGGAMNLMEILRDDSMGFQAKVDAHNASFLGKGEVDVSLLPGSPALRRGVGQAVRIVDEIVAITGKQPLSIFVEVTRSEDPRLKGKRTTQRHRAIQNAIESLKSDRSIYYDTDVHGQLKERGNKELDERLMLYFIQMGKCMYSGKRLDINRLHSYQVDHIIPRSYIKDDSIENKALVLPEKNQRKGDSLLLDPSIIEKQRGFWRALYDAKAIGPKKYHNLMRRTLEDEQLKGFIARQLVETSQMVKHTQQLLQAKYSEAKVLPVKATLTSALREACGFVKCREANDFHHAHDALLACQMGRFVQYRHPDVHEKPIKMAHAMRKYVRQDAEEFRRTGRMPGSAGFIVSSFKRSGFDGATGEIFIDGWDAQFEEARIRRLLNYRDCFITRMQEEGSGSFWKETIISPKAAGKRELALKKGLDPNKYGSYNEIHYAYFFVFEVARKKDGKRLLEYAGVPIHIAKSIVLGALGLDDYAKTVMNSDKFDFVAVRKRKIPKWQKVRIDGCELYILGAKDVRNATQLAFTQAETALIKRMLDSSDSGDSASLSPEEYARLYEVVAAKMERFAKRFSEQLSPMDRIAKFQGLQSAEKAKVLKDIIGICNAQIPRTDLSAIGGSGEAGRIKLGFSSLLSNPSVDFWFIDSSVTGMFERRYKLGL